MDKDKRFEILSNITRASHFEWRRAALALNPELDPLILVKKYWEEVGKDTARFYVRKIDHTKDVARQVAELYVSSSVAMGEDAEIAEDSQPGYSRTCHRDCPWYHWHKREGLLAEDQPGCDEWVRTVVNEVNKALGSSVKFETVESLPEGGSSCTRRFWEEK